MSYLHPGSLKYRDRNRTLAEIVVIDAFMLGVLLAFYAIDNTPNSIVRQPWFLAALMMTAQIGYLAWTLRSTKRLRGARSEVERDPANPDAYYRLALCLFEKDNIAEAVRQFRNAVQLDTQLNIRRPHSSIHSMIARRAANKPEEHRFIKWMMPRACALYVMDEADRVRRRSIRADSSEAARLQHIGHTLRTLHNLRIELAKRESNAARSAGLPWQVEDQSEVRRDRELQQLRRLIDDLEALIRNLDPDA